MHAITQLIIIHSRPPPAAADDGAHGVIPERVPVARDAEERAERRGQLGPDDLQDVLEEKRQAEKEAFRRAELQKGTAGIIPSSASGGGGGGDQAPRRHA